jgi:predicted nucleic acid-binding protein
MYLDSAIVVKLLVREADSDWFDRALAGQSFESSELALTEVRSALLAKERNGHITPVERGAAAEQFRAMVEDETIRLLTLNRTVVERASQIQFACRPLIPLRTLDALHVATCDLHRSGGMCTTDGRMRAACNHFAITLLPQNMDEIAADSARRRT